MKPSAHGDGSIHPLPRPLYLALALGFCLSWASAFPAAKLVVEAAPPLLALGMRFLLAGGLLLAWFAARGGRLGALPWRRLALLGLLNQVGYMGFAWLGMTSVSAGLATIIASLNPVLVGALAAPVLGERMHGRKLVGLLLGLAGAAIVVRERVALDHERMVGVVEQCIALAALVAGTLAFKRLAGPVPLVAAVGAQQMVAAVVLLAAGGLLENPAHFHPSAAFWAGFAWLVLGVSVGSYLIWFLLLRRGTASAASALHFLIPPIGLVMSWAALGEPLRWSDLLGVVPIAIGIRLAVGREPGRAGYVPSPRGAGTIPAERR